jgi:hypothetical protein
LKAIAADGILVAAIVVVTTIGASYDVVIAACAVSSNGQRRRQGSLAAPELLLLESYAQLWHSIIFARPRHSSIALLPLIYVFPLGIFLVRTTVLEQKRNFEVTSPVATNISINIMQKEFSS